MQVKLLAVSYTHLDVYKRQTQEMEEVTPKTLINIRPVTAAMKEFFGSSQLSQFMDQTNPIAELDVYKRQVLNLHHYNHTK